MEAGVLYIALFVTSRRSCSTPSDTVASGCLMQLLRVLVMNWDIAALNLGIARNVVAVNDRVNEGLT